MARPESIDQPVIVQFFHSAKEYNVKARRGEESVEVPWSLEKPTHQIDSLSAGCSSHQTDKKRGGCGGDCGDSGENVWTSDHSRRLVVHVGECIDDRGIIQTEELAFWTEWEACSTAMKMPAARVSPTKGNKPLARWIHTVTTPLGKSGFNRVNTDPCVFGKSFKYCCCLQHRKGEKNKCPLRQLPAGSIILFGGRLKGDFVLDTVFVVGDIAIPYLENTKKKLDVSDTYREVSLNRFSNRIHENTFYRGATFQDSNGKKPYSFVPARPFVPGDSSCGERFVPDLAAVNGLLRETGKEFKPESGKTQGFQMIKAPEATVKAVWNEVLRQVHLAHFMPGIHFDWPE